MASTGTHKLILNVDPGIDDAQAILLALASPNVEVLGLCVHHGNTSIENATTNTLKLLSVIGRLDVPVFRGCERALVNQPDEGDNYFGTDGLGDVEGLFSPSEDMIQSEHAVLAMIRLVKQYPGQITMVGLGPLTNLAIAIRLYPDFGKNLKDCFIMGGNYRGQGNITRCAEFNTYFDAEAAKVVLKEFPCRIVLFTWELCLDSGMPWDVSDSLRAMPGTKAKFMKTVESKLIDKWKKNPSWVICDELAIAGALDERCMKEWKEVSVDVECGGELTRGQLVIDWSDLTKRPKNVWVVTKMDMEMVKELLQRAHSE